MTAIERAILLAVGRDGYRGAGELHDLVDEAVGDLLARDLLREARDGVGTLLLTDAGDAARTEIESAEPDR